MCILKFPAGVATSGGYRFNKRLYCTHLIVQGIRNREGKESETKAS